MNLSALLTEINGPSHRSENAAIGPLHMVTLKSCN